MMRLRYAIALLTLPLFISTALAQQTGKASKPVAKAASPAAAKSKSGTAQNSLRRWVWSSGLGLYVASIDAVLAKDLHLKITQGLYIFAAASDGAAYKAGVRPGDVLVGFSPGNLWSEEGKSGGLLIYRNAKLQKLNVTAGTAAFGKNLIRSPASRKGHRTLQVGPRATYRTVTAAAIQAQPGDTIVLTPGTYREAVQLPPGVKVRAQDRLSARIEGAHWSVFDGEDVELSGLAFAGGGLVLVNTNKVLVADCEFQARDKMSVISMSAAKQAILRKVTINGGEGTTGISAVKSEFSVEESAVSGHGTAFRVNDESKAEVRDSLIERNKIAFDARQSELVAENNIVGGLWAPDVKTEGTDAAFRVVGGSASLKGNTVRGHHYGILASSAATPIVATENIVTQTGHGVVLLSRPAKFSANLIMQNAYNGVYVARSTSAKQDDPPPEVELVRNTISENGRSGVQIEDSQSAKLVENLIEGNFSGVRVEAGRADIMNNTIVTQRGPGLNIRAHSDVRIYNNIVALNKFGVVLDVTARSAGGFNDVYNNLATTTFPLRDANYVVTDRYVTRDGKKILMDVYPRYDIKFEGDANVDPAFVEPGRDYSLKPSSPLIQMKGAAHRFIGAYPPPDSGPSSQAHDDNKAASKVATTTNTTNRLEAVPKEASPKANSPRKQREAALERPSKELSHDGGAKDSAKGGRFAGRWLINATCPTGKYAITANITAASGSNVAGTTTSTSGFNTVILGGSVSGNTIRFRRRTSNFALKTEDTITGTLVGASKMTGTITGGVQPSACQFTARR